MKLLVTGAGGFIGAAVTHAAAAAGHDVVATIRPRGDRTRIASLAGRITVVEIDLRDFAGVTEMMRTERPETVVHVAWSGVDNKSRLDASQRNDNIETSCNLLDAGIAIGIRKFVGLGSQGEYGQMMGKIAENALTEPSSMYGAAKLAVLYLTRQMAAQANVSFVWLRLFSTYGPGDKPNWLIPTLIETMLDGARPKTTLGTQLWDYLFIEDVATAILATAVEPKANGVFNLGSGRPVQVRMIVEMLREKINPKIELVFGEIAYGPNQVWHMEADIARLCTSTGWRPQISLSDGLDTTIDWHKRQRLSKDSFSVIQNA